MAITTVDGAIAGFQPTRYFHKTATPTMVAGKPQSLWYLAGIPGPGAAPAASMAGNILKSTDTVTITIASPGVVTQTGHNLVNGNTVVLSTTGALPTGLTAGTTYFVVSAGTGTYSLAATSGGAAINTSGSQSGTHTAQALIDGQLPFYDPAAGNSYLSRFVGASNSPCRVMLCDRLWHNGNFTNSTSAQTVNSVTWPARDANGATTGVGVQIALEYNAAGAGNAPTMNMQYTNTVGTGSRTGNFVFPTSATPAIGSFFPISLAAGDVGVQSIQSVTLSAAATANSCNLVAYRILAVCDSPGAWAPLAIDILTGGMPQIYNGSVPFLVLVPSATVGTQTIGNMAVTQG